MIKRSYCFLRVVVFHSKLARYLVRCTLVFCKLRYNRFNLWYDLTRPSHWGAMWIWWEFLVVCSSCGVTASILKVEICFQIVTWFYMTLYLKGHITLYVEASHGKSPTWHVAGYWFCASGYIKYWICHMTLQNHMIT